mgnify:CR=1 FL=1
MHSLLSSFSLLHTLFLRGWEKPMPPPRHRLFFILPPSPCHCIRARLSHKRLWRQAGKCCVDTRRSSKKTHRHTGRMSRIFLVLQGRRHGAFRLRSRFRREIRQAPWSCFRSAPERVCRAWRRPCPPLTTYLLPFPSLRGARDAAGRKVLTQGAIAVSWIASLRSQ